jgi:hypothetical protein
MLLIDIHSARNQQLLLNTLFRLFHLSLVTVLAHFLHPPHHISNTRDQLHLNLSPLNLRRISQISNSVLQVLSTPTTSSHLSNRTVLLRLLHSMGQATKLHHTISILKLTARHNLLDPTIRMPPSSMVLPSLKSHINNRKVPILLKMVASPQTLPR